MNFKLPQQDDDFDYYANSSQDESRGSQGTHCFQPFSIHLKINRTHISFMLKLNIFLHIVLFSSNLLEVCIIKCFSSFNDDREFGLPSCELTC